MKKLWQKDNTSISSLNEAYVSGENVELDNALVMYDVYCTVAHIKMLHAIKLLEKKDLQALEKELNRITELYSTGDFLVEDGDEDIHTKIEQHLIRALGDIGKKVHTGRSRNDQILTDLQLYSKDQLGQLAELILNCINSFLSFADENTDTMMPGYTHMQPAMPSTVGLWASSFAESLLDDLEGIDHAYLHNNKSPLGSAASYGVPLPLDRKKTAELLGFETVTINSLYSQASRSKLHVHVVHACVEVMITLGRFAQDLLLFTTKEFQLFVIDTSVTTGSSIMPQKMNIDSMEVLRARLHRVAGNYNSIVSMSGTLPSGYNSDIQESKKLLFEAVEITQKSVDICSYIIKHMQPNLEALQQKMYPELYATQHAYELVKKGMPFRQAYQTIGNDLSSISPVSNTDVVNLSTHIGGLGNLGLDTLRMRRNQSASSWERKIQSFRQTIQQLLQITQ